MAEYKGVNILDALIFLVQRKRFFAILFLASLIFSYLLIYVALAELG